MKRGSAGRSLFEPGVGGETAAGQAVPQGIADDAVRPYLSIEQLAVMTPWSMDAIEQMIRRHALQRGVHYFQPFGVRTQRRFKWAAIVALIEGATEPNDEPVLQKRRSETAVSERVIDVEKAATGLQRLLR